MKRLLSLALCAVLVLGIVFPVYAAEDSTTESTQTSVSVDPTETPTPSDPTETSEPSEPTGTSAAVDPTETSDPVDPTEASAPTDPTETPLCDQCNAAKNEDGVIVHEKSCPDYVKTCTCIPAEGVHQEGCDFYVKTEFDVAALKQCILECESVEEVERLISTLTEVQVKALIDLLSEDEIRTLAEKLDVNLDIEVITPPASYTSVGPLMPAVPVRSTFKMRRVAANPLEDENGLILNKTAKYNSETNTVTITLEAYTTGTVTSSSKSVPVDVVLVLDESGSMKDKINQYSKVYVLDTNKTYYVKSGTSYIKVSYCNGGLFGSHDPGWYSGSHFFVHWGERYEPMTSGSDTADGHVQFYEASAGNVTKQQALINAAKSFATSVYTDAVNNEVDHRMSVIGFSDNGNSSIKVYLNQDIRNNISNVTQAIGGLRANGGTYIEDGLTNAEKVFRDAPAPATTERKRVVVIFTDGIPGSGTWNNDTITNSANPAIATSNTLKNHYGATVYTIGMLDNANPALPISDESNDAARTNKFLHFLSTNYPNAKSMTDGGTGANNGYYLAASDTASLNAIFEKIADEISTPSILLDGNAVIKDVIAPSFNVPTNASAIALYTEDYNGTQFDGTRDPADGVTATIENDTINVSGFDYNKNFISDKQHDGTYGKKLIIEFTVAPKDGFLGGNNVNTNGETSGLYETGESETALENFDLPQVNIPIKDITVNAEDKNVYLLQNINADQLKSGVSIKAGDIGFDLSKENYGLQTWQADYVNISVKITDQNNEEITDFSNLLGDNSYKVSVTVTPKTDGTGADGTPAEGVSGDDTGNISVFKPVITFQDTAVAYNEQANFDNTAKENRNLVSVAWKHGETVADATAMGAAPTLTYAYSSNGTVFTTSEPTLTQETSVKVAVSIGQQDITSHVSFWRNQCTAENGCGFAGGSVSATDNNRVNFIVHIKTFDLTIVKQDVDQADGRAPFVFNIKGGNVDMNVVIYGNGRVIIKNLPAGDYTVEEVGGYWRYDITQAKPSQIQNANAQKNEVTFRNTRTNNQWLDGFASATNKFTGATR